MAADKSKILQGALDLMVLTLAAMGPLHGFGITRVLRLKEQG